MSTPDNPELIMPEEACRILGIRNRTSMYRAIKAGNFPKPVKIGDSLRFVKSECHDYVRRLVAQRDKP